MLLRKLDSPINELGRYFVQNMPQPLLLYLSLFFEVGQILLDFFVLLALLHDVRNRELGIIGNGDPGYLATQEVALLAIENALHEAKAAPLLRWQIDTHYSDKVTQE